MGDRRTDAHPFVSREGALRNLGRGSNGSPVSARQEPDGSPMQLRCHPERLRRWRRRGWPTSRRTCPRRRRIGGLAVVRAGGGMSIWVHAADTGVGEVRTATSEDGEDGLLLRRGSVTGLMCMS